MFIAHLVIDDSTALKLGRRAISQHEVHELRRNGAIALRNPRPRVEGSRLLVGPTDGGRLLTVVIEPDLLDEAIWHVRSAWDTGGWERRAYHRRN